MTINVENLNKAADHLEDPNFKGRFNMCYACQCALGYSVALLENGRGLVNPPEVVAAAPRVFGIPHVSDEWNFCFGSVWGLKEEGNDPKAAAARLRYVARHGAAPSKDQWPRFATLQTPVKVGEVPEEACV